MTQCRHALRLGLAFGMLALFGEGALGNSSVGLRVNSHACPQIGTVTYVSHVSARGDVRIGNSHGRAVKKKEAFCDHERLFYTRSAVFAADLNKEPYAGARVVSKPGNIRISQKWFGHIHLANGSPTPTDLGNFTIPPWYQLTVQHPSHVHPAVPLTGSTTGDCSDLVGREVKGHLTRHCNQSLDVRSITMAKGSVLQVKGDLTVRHGVRGYGTVVVTLGKATIIGAVKTDSLFQLHSANIILVGE